MFSGTPTLPFPREEHLARQAILRRALAAKGFDAILVFAQESHYWLTGYDSGGSVFFQSAVITADDTPITLLTRRPDLLQARQTSTIEDIRLWWDAEDADPAGALREIMREKGLAGKTGRGRDEHAWPDRLEPAARCKPRWPGSARWNSTST